MPETFPSLGHVGNQFEVSVKRIRRRYDDATQRSYARSTNKHRVLTLVWRGINQATRDAIQTFIEARLVDNAEFFVYNPQETQVMSGSTGRHTCDEIIGDTSGWTMEGKCRYSGELKFFLKD